MKFFNTSAYLTIITIVFIGIVYKILNVDITHDEVATTVHYYNFSVWQIMMYPDNWPNNHILNTLLTKLFINIFGKEQWVVRMPNLLSFIIYAYAIYRLTTIYFKKESLLFIAAISLFLANPYLLDFFGLSRGYAMATSLATLSASFLITAYYKSKESHIWAAIILASLSSYANFTTLIFWLTILILSGVYFLIYYWGDVKKIFAKLVLLFLISISYFALIFVPLQKMTSTNQFKYWTSKGFYNDTILSLIENWRYNNGLFDDIENNTFGIVIILIYLAALVIIIKNISFKKSIIDNFKNPLLISFLILSITIFVNLIQVLVMKTPNLNGRTAIFLYPLFVIILLGIISKIDKTKVNWLKYSISIIIPIISFYHLANTYKSQSVREWWYDENTLDVIDYIKSENPNGEVTLKTQWWFYPSFYFYTYTGKAPEIILEENKNHEVNENSSADYYYIMESDKTKIEHEYTPIKKFGWDRWLMIKKAE